MLRIERLSHNYGDIVALRAVSLELDAGEILCLLGPSGCGKTTLLRIIAGLEADYAGRVVFKGEDMRAIPTHKRGFGLMFQDFALFPHLSAAENIAYGLRRQGLRRKEIAPRVQSLLRRVGLEDLDERDVASLSGGQKQRVALARSLAPNPRLLMLDEPLGSLDAQLRDQLALELRRIIKLAGLSAIYVTHDHREAYAVADRIAVMNVGSLQQHDKPRELYHQPVTASVARFLGLSNIFSLAEEPVFKALCLDVAGWRHEAKSILIHPAGIELAGAGADGRQGLLVRLEDAVFRGHHYDASVIAPPDIRLSFAARELPAAVGETLRIRIRPDAIVPLAE